jgi:hypothetical protein
MPLINEEMLNGLNWPFYYLQAFWQPPCFKLFINPLTFSSVKFNPGTNWFARLMNGVGFFLNSLNLKFCPL